MTTDDKRQPLDRGPRMPHTLPASCDQPDVDGFVQVYNVRDDSHTDGDLCECNSILYDNVATAAAIVHRVNGWDALCDRVVAAEAEVKRLLAERGRARGLCVVMLGTLDRLWERGIVGVSVSDEVRQAVSEWEGAAEKGEAR